MGDSDESVQQTVPASCELLSKTGDLGESSEAKEENKTPPPKPYVYRCFKCRTYLFDADALDEKLPGHEDCATLCFKIDAEHGLVEHKQGGGVSGNLSCPKCAYKVGKVCLYGVKCACGKFTTVCRTVTPSKV